MKCELYNDSFQNWKSYPIQKAQLIIADIPYNLGDAAYGSNPMWYVGGDNKNGESDKAKSTFFTSDGYFRIAEYFMFCSRLMKPEPKQGKGGAPCMIVFCAYQQQHDVIRWAAEMRRNAYGFEIDRKFYREAKEKMLNPETLQQSSIDDIFIEARKVEQMTLAGVIA